MIDVSGVGSCCRVPCNGSRDIAKTCARAVAAHKADNGLDDITAKEAATDVVDVKPEVETGAYGVRAVDPGEVIYELWRRNRTGCMWRQAVWRVNVGERSEHAVVRPDRYFLRVGEVRVGLTKSEHFFFQAEDGIRVRNVTGVQTCALPI